MKVKFDLKNWNTPVTVNKNRIKIKWLNRYTRNLDDQPIQILKPYYVSVFVNPCYCLSSTRKKCRVYQ